MLNLLKISIAVKAAFFVSANTLLAEESIHNSELLSDHGVFILNTLLFFTSFCLYKKGFYLSKIMEGKTKGC